MSTSANSSRRKPPAAAISLLIWPLVPVISWMTARHIGYHRRQLLPKTVALPRELLPSFETYFPPVVLLETRIVQASMPKPVLYPLVRMFGIKGILEMSSIGAITLVDVVAYPAELDRSTLFHELVHVVQYRVLGLQRFAELYVKGFLAGGGYEGIPLERQAYELGARFDQRPGDKFSVEEDVIRRHADGRL